MVRVWMRGGGSDCAPSLANPSDRLADRTSVNIVTRYELAASASPSSLGAFSSLALRTGHRGDSR
jgi:hypothetical protein